MAVLSVDGPDDGIAVLTLNRPEKRNALSTELRDEVSDALDALANDDALKVVVVTGAGDVFSAGFDLGEFQVEDAAFQERLWASSDRFHATCLRFPLPMIAAVNGPALAGGFDLAIMCDIRVCSTTTRFAHPEITFGDVVYGPLHDLVGGAVARDLCLTGRPVDADDALRLGLVSRVVAPDQVMPAALELAALSARAPRDVLLRTKAKAIRRAGVVTGADPRPLTPDRLPGLARAADDLESAQPAAAALPRAVGPCFADQSPAVRTAVGVEVLVLHHPRGSNADCGDGVPGARRVGDRQPGADPLPEPQRVPPPVGRRGRAVRSRRGDAAADAVRGRVGVGDHPDLRDPLPRRPLPRPAGRRAAPCPRSRRAPRTRALPGQRNGVLGAAALGGDLRRPRRRGGGAGARRRGRGHVRDGRPPPDRACPRPPHRRLRVADRGARWSPHAAGPPRGGRHHRAGRRPVAARWRDRRERPADHARGDERAPPRPVDGVRDGHRAVRRRVRAGRRRRPARVRGDVPVGRRGARGRRTST